MVEPRAGGSMSPSSAGAPAALDAGVTSPSADAASEPPVPPQSDVLAEITVQAGELTRERTVVTFRLPEGASLPTDATGLALRDAQGVERPVQLDPTGSFAFILPSLAAGAETVFELIVASTAFPEDATVVDTGGVISLQLAGSPVIGFQVDGQPPMGIEAASIRGGYLHPFFTPAGTMVTGDYPADHTWHHGIWSAWARARFDGRIVDFWTSYKLEGRVDLEAGTPPGRAPCTRVSSRGSLTSISSARPRPPP
jgi:hypothetical protein